jgi:hypothetical protein
MVNSSDEPDLKQKNNGVIHTGFIVSTSDQQCRSNFFFKWISSEKWENQVKKKKPIYVPFTVQ